LAYIDVAAPETHNLSLLLDLCIESNIDELIPKTEVLGQPQILF
jgi:hypothetical protein